MAADESVTFGIKVDSDPGSAKEDAAALETYRKKIDAAKEAIANYSQSLRLLRGKSDEVKAAREKLKAAIEAERGAITKANAAILKAGSSYAQLTKKAKEAKAASLDFGKSLPSITEWVENLPAKGAAAFAVLTAALVAAAIAIGTFAITGANALRNMSLEREATAGAENAEAWGTQIEALGRKVPTTREELNKLAVTVDKAFRGTKLSGQGMVDVFAAVGSAAAANGDEAGRVLQGIFERSKRFGRVGIGFTELQGTGLKIGDVAKTLAKNLKIGVDEAQRALLMGAVGIDAAAKAVRDAVEARFGEVNAKKMLDLGVIWKKLQDNLQGLTERLSKSAGFQAFLANLSKLASLLDVTTPAGKELAGVLDAFGEALGALSSAALPYVVIGIKEMVLWGLKAYNAILDLAIASIRFAQSAAGYETIKAVLLGIGAVLAVLVATAAVLGVALAGALAFVGLFIEGIAQIGEAMGDFVYNLVNVWPKAAADFVAGLAKGIVNGAGQVVQAVKDMGREAWTALTDFWKVRSPSQLAFGLGANIGEGKARGLEAKSARVEEAALSMTPAPAAVAGESGGAASPGGAGGRPLVVQAIFNIPAGAGARETVDAIRSSSVLDSITYAVTTALRGAGVPTGAPAPSGG